MIPIYDDFNITYSLTKFFKKHYIDDFPLVGVIKSKIERELRRIARKQSNVEENNTNNEYSDESSMKPFKTNNYSTEKQVINNCYFKSNSINFLESSLRDAQVNLNSKPKNINLEKKRTNFNSCLKKVDNSYKRKRRTLLKNYSKKSINRRSMENLKLKKNPSIHQLKSHSLLKNQKKFTRNTLSQWLSMSSKKLPIQKSKKCSLNKISTGGFGKKHSRLINSNAVNGYRTLKKKRANLSIDYKNKKPDSLYLMTKRRKSQKKSTPKKGLINLITKFYETPKNNPHINTSAMLQLIFKKLDCTEDGFINHNCEKELNPRIRYHLRGAINVISNSKTPVDFNRFLNIVTQTVSIFHLQKVNNG